MTYGPGRVGILLRPAAGRELELELIQVENLNSVTARVILTVNHKQRLSAAALRASEFPESHPEPVYNIRVQVQE